MDKEFTVLDGKKSNNIDFSKASRLLYISQLWCAYYDRLARDLMQRANTFNELAKLPQDELMKFACVGIKTVCANRDAMREYEIATCDRHSQSLEEAQQLFNLIDNIYTICGMLTLRNFVTTFPITKEYDGAKWEWKDYFYTMQELSKMEWDKPIGRENVKELLWDYMNDDLRHTDCEYTCAMSTLYKAQTGKGIMEQFCEDNDIPTYTINKPMSFR